jgi:hypothetical protein
MVKIVSGCWNLVALYYVGYNIIIYQATEVRVFCSFSAISDFWADHTHGYFAMDLQILSKNRWPIVSRFIFIKFGEVLTTLAYVPSCLWTHLLMVITENGLCTWTNSCCLRYHPGWFLKKDLEKWHNISSGQKDRAHAKLKSHCQLHTVPLACAAWNNMLFFLQEFLFLRAFYWCVDTPRKELLSIGVMSHTYPLLLD